MCVVSMVMDYYTEKWQPLTKPWEEWRRWDSWPHNPPGISQAEITEFRQLLERARKYDLEHGQPDCELETKRQTLIGIAKTLGIEIVIP